MKKLSQEKIKELVENKIKWISRCAEVVPCSQLNCDELGLSVLDALNPFPQSMMAPVGTVYRTGRHRGSDLNKYKIVHVVEGMARMYRPVVWECLCELSDIVWSNFNRNNLQSEVMSIFKRLKYDEKQEWYEQCHELICDGLKLIDELDYIDTQSIPWGLSSSWGQVLRCELGDVVKKTIRKEIARLTKTLPRGKTGPTG